MSAPQRRAPIGLLDGTRPAERPRLLRRGLRLEYATLGWNVIGVVVLAITALAAGSVALAGFGIDSLIEILASTVVIWQLRGTDDSSRIRPALRVIAVAFALLAIYITVQSAVTLIAADHPGPSLSGAAWLGVTAVAMFALAYGKADTGRRLGNPVLRTEARITVIDGALALAVLTGVLLNGGREARHAWHESTAEPPS